MASSIPPAWAESDYPRLVSLKPSDVLFVQLQDDIQHYYRTACSGRQKTPPALAFFAYAPSKDDTLFSLAARLNLPYETIATCNGISQAVEFFSRSEIVIPNLPGIFAPESPANALEEILAYRLRDEAPKGERIVIRQGRSVRSYIFYRGERFHPVERAFFLRILFFCPVARSIRTSDFGPRPDPFTGHPSFHHGIDLAAPVGSDVFAAREGVVKETGYNPSIGNFVKVAHPGGFETLYGHMGAVFVKSGQKVKSGSVLGKVGMTGRTTGPHLHFEVHKNGTPIDPSSLL